MNELPPTFASFPAFEITVRKKNRMTGQEIAEPKKMYFASVEKLGKKLQDAMLKCQNFLNSYFNEIEGEWDKKSFFALIFFDKHCLTSLELDPSKNLVFEIETKGEEDLTPWAKKYPNYLLNDNIDINMYLECSGQDGSKTTGRCVDYSQVCSLQNGARNPEAAVAIALFNCESIKHIMQSNGDGTKTSSVIIHRPPFFI